MKSTFSTKITRDYKLGMPKMFFGGISENWFLKEFGDLHWELIAKSYNTDADKLVDSNGSRLYASFVRLKWESNRDLAAFKESDDCTVKTEISRFGNKMFFSEQELSGTRKKINASLMTVFSSRSTNNTSLKKAVPISEIDERTTTHESLPDFAKGFLTVKSNLLGEEKLTWNHELKGYTFEESESSIAEYTYEIEPYTDINGVGLLYFASYPTINDKCERAVFNQLFDIQENDWAHLGSCAARDIFYFGNANPQDKLIYKLNNYEFVGRNKIVISSSIYREADNVLISKQFTVRNLAKDWKKHKSEHVDLKKVKDEQKVINSAKSSKSSTLPRELLLKEICGFIAKMMGEKSVSGNTDLSLLGVESVLFMELSEHLNQTLEVNSNPSKFYGLKNCNEIADSLMETEEVEQEIQKELSADEEIAIVATSFKIPGANSMKEFWKLLKEGRSAIGTLPESRWNWPNEINVSRDHKGINRGGFIDGIDEFDPTFFNISPVEAELMDPQQRLLLELSWNLMENASHNPKDYLGRKTGVFIGASGSDYDQLVYSADTELSVTGSAQALLANRISYFYDLKGPSKTIDTACSSSLVALNDAVEAIKNGQCAEAIVGGIHLMCNSAKTVTYYNSKMLSIDGKCQTFDENANGYVRAEGAVMFLLKAKSQALTDGDNILGVVKSTSVNHGGRVSGVTVPNPKQQANLVVDALNKGGVNLGDLSYIEAHGTGTSLGDPIEINGLNEVAKRMNRNSTPKSCGLGSVKTNVGHLEAASGLVGVLKVLASMRYKELPATINFDQINPKIDFAGGPFYIQDSHTEWPLKEGKEERLAGVSNFGVGGTNAHVIIGSLEQEKKNETEINDQSELFVLSAKTKGGLITLAKNIGDYLKEKIDPNLKTLARTLQLGRAELKFRVAIPAKSKGQLIDEIESFTNDQPSRYQFGKRNEAVESIVDESLLTKLANDDNREEILKEIANQWVAGAMVNWNRFNSSKTSRYFDLPNYPFEREKYWLNVSDEKEAESPNSFIQPAFDGSEFMIQTNTKRFEHTGADLWRFAFPELMQEVAASSGNQKPFALKNVFWNRSEEITKLPSKLRTRLIRDEDDTYFEMSSEDRAVFFGELIEQCQLDSISIDKMEKMQVTSENVTYDINEINTVLRKNGEGQIKQLHKIQNSYYGEFIIQAGGKSSNQDYAEALFSLWIVYKLIKDRSGGVNALKESYSPYFSSEVKFNGKLDSTLRFKITDHGSSCDLHFYDQNGQEQLAIKKLKEGKQSTDYALSN